MATGTVPEKFVLSYTIPLLKGNGVRMSKSLTVHDFRGISISPAISKIFENCILRKYKNFFITSDNQFGFKKFTGCSHAIYTVRQSVEFFANSGTTVNLCARDVSKAFDKVIHFGLFIKLMDRVIPVAYLGGGHSAMAPPLSRQKNFFAGSVQVKNPETGFGESGEHSLRQESAST